VQAVRALITGGRGFVGTWLSEALVERGADVVLVDRETDVADPEAIGPRVAAAEPDVIFHLAALSHVGDSWASPSAVLRVNVLGTAEVLAAARALPRPPVVLVVSSAEVYGIVRPEDLPLREDAPVIPSSPYAASKAAAEQVALQAWRGFGQHVVVVRPFNHIGPGQAPTFAVSALARRIVQAGRTGATELSVGTMSTRRDFTDVRDVVRAYLC
jgi:GDP-4-dehydro-6-deoxy-D-mannose reductase